jgi:hypothetical protein
VAVKLLPWLEREAKDRQLATLKQNATDKPKTAERMGQAHDIAAEQVHVGHTGVGDVKRLTQVAPQVGDQVPRGVS